jgi:hypothetical protein
MVVSNSARETTLTGLEEFSTYNISVMGDYEIAVRSATTLPGG